MKAILFLAGIFLCLTVYSQANKGGAPIQSAVGSLQSAESKTFAVVVGISDYQDPDIPDLRFADRDAEVFTQYLQSPAGGSLDADHLQLVTNEEATAGNIISALFWLLEVCGEDDRAIIYFSGHGDVESRLSDQPGYLLCWDALSRVYAAGGVVELAMMQQVISTLSQEKKAKVLLITDACRSGKLSGSAIGGPQMTAASMMQQYANEVKILSCQPDEYSIEGEQWGGGRGAFSYHLIDGLSGLADDNEDGTVTLLEIGRYLQDQVATEVAPLSQIPMTVGNFKEELVRVDQAILEEIRQSRDMQFEQFAATDHRGIRDQVLSEVDTATAGLFYAFEQALTDARFLRPEGDCAEYYYQQCLAASSLGPLHSMMTRNYAAALQDDAQQVINRLLRGDAEENAKPFSAVKAEYGHYPADLRRAAELLGEDHYMYNPLMARSYWFEAYVADESRCACYNPENADKVLPFYRKALQYQPDMPHAWMFMAAVYGIEKRQLDSAEYFADLAKEAIPGWNLVFSWMGNIYVNAYWSDKNKLTLDQAKKWLDLGFEQDSMDSQILDQLAFYYNVKEMYRQEQEILDRSFAIDSLAQTQFFKGQGYADWGKYEEAEAAFLHAIRIDSNWLLEGSGLFVLYAKTRQREKLDKLWESPFIQSRSNVELKKITDEVFITNPDKAQRIYSGILKTDSTNTDILNRYALSYTYQEDGDYRKALHWHKQAVKFGSSNPLYHNNEGLIYLRWNEVEQAERKFRDALALDSTFTGAYTALFMLYLQNGKTEKAEEVLQKGMEIDSIWPPDFLRWTGHRNLQDPETVPMYFQKMEEMYPHNPHIHSAFAKHLSFFKDDTNAAYRQLEIALEKGIKGPIDRDWFLAPLQMERDRWYALMRKYRPELVWE